jgi:hypothetical protein
MSAHTQSRPAGSTEGLALAALFALGGLSVVIASASALLVRQLDYHGVTDWGYDVVPGLVILILFAAAARQAWRARAPRVLLPLVVTIVATLAYIFGSLPLAYLCLNYGANPLLGTGCAGSVPNGWLVSVSVLGMAAGPVIAALGTLIALVLRARTRWSG